MVSFNPRKIYGRWTEGYVLDLHTTGSVFLGDDALGHPQFETHRTEVGELLYQLKYREDQSVVTEICRAAELLVKRWRIQIDMIVPVPPTRVDRTLQPVELLAEELGSRLAVPVTKDAIRKLGRFAELKNVYDAEERRKLLEGAFEVNGPRVTGQRILLFDDLYRSGATMNAVTEALIASGASVVYAFALTQTRRGG